MKTVASCHKSQKRGALEICKLKIIKNNLVVSRGKKEFYSNIFGLLCVFEKVRFPLIANSTCC